MAENPLSNTGERVLPERFESAEDWLVYLRHEFAYRFALGEIPEGSQVLDIGSGEGYGTASLLETAKSVVGLDVDESSVVHAKARYGSERCFFRSFDGETIPYEVDAFDAVVSFQVIEHVESVRKYLGEVQRVLRPEGVFLVTTPNRAYRLDPGQRPWNRFHLREFSADELRAALVEFFPATRLLGVRGSESAQRIEVERVRQIRRIDSYDPLRLRRLFPSRLQPALIRAAKMLFGKKRKASRGPADFREKYDVNDFHVIEDDLEESLDLLGVCRRERPGIRS